MPEINCPALLVSAQIPDALVVVDVVVRRLVVDRRPPLAAARAAALVVWRRRGEVEGVGVVVVVDVVGGQDRVVSGCRAATVEPVLAIELEAVVLDDVVGLDHDPGPVGVVLDEVVLDRPAVVVALADDGLASARDEVLHRQVLDGRVGWRGLGPSCREGVVVVALSVEDRTRCADERVAGSDVDRGERSRAEGVGPGSEPVGRVRLDRVVLRDGRGAVVSRRDAHGTRWRTGIGRGRQACLAPGDRWRRRRGESTASA